MLRRLILQVTSVSYEPVDSVDAAAVSDALREALLAAVDAAFADAANAPAALRANSARQFRIFRDVQAVLSGDMGRPIYSAELAKQIGVQSARCMTRSSGIAGSACIATSA